MCCCQIWRRLAQSNETLFPTLCYHRTQDTRQNSGPSQQRIIAQIIAQNTVGHAKFESCFSFQLSCRSFCIVHGDGKCLFVAALFHAMWGLETRGSLTSFRIVHVQINQYSPVFFSGLKKSDLGWCGLSPAGLHTEVCVDSASVDKKADLHWSFFLGGGSLFTRRGKLHNSPQLNKFIYTR